jgi:hypothetical protein
VDILKKNKNRRKEITEGENHPLNHNDTREQLLQKGLRWKAPIRLG